MWRRALVAVGAMALLIAASSSASTRFKTRDGLPIDDIRVQGNREIGTHEVLAALDLGPDDFENAVKTMRGVLPYFSVVDWRVSVEGGSRIATVRVIEGVHGSGPFGTHGHASPTFALNRVSGFDFGVRAEVWKHPNLRTPPRGRLFVGISRALSGGFTSAEGGAWVSAGWFRDHGLRISGRGYRGIAVFDALAQPEDSEQFVMALLYNGELRDYYLRTGAEASVRWANEHESRVLELALVDEQHDSLSAELDWSLFAPRGTARTNPAATEGDLRSIVVRIRSQSSDSRYAIDAEAEHAPDSGSAYFAFTRARAQTTARWQAGRYGVRARLLVGTTDGEPPIQRRFWIGGPASVRGYDIGEFVGRHVMLANVEVLRGPFVVYVDVGQTADIASDLGDETPPAGVGVGFRLGDGFRINLSQALDNRSPEAHIRWARMF